MHDLPSRLITLVMDQNPEFVDWSIKHREALPQQWIEGRWKNPVPFKIGDYCGKMFPHAGTTMFEIDVDGEILMLKLDKNDIVFDGTDISVTKLKLYI